MKAARLLVAIYRARAASQLEDQLVERLAGAEHHLLALLAHIKILASDTQEVLLPGSRANRVWCSKLPIKRST
jgi:hypothetical protein